MTVKSGPKGWNAMTTDTRFADVAPQSYDKKARTVDAVISMGSPVKRFYGTEVLRIDDKSIVLDRVKRGGIPLLDSHNQYGIDNALGRINETWIKRGALLGKIRFNETEEGRKAEGMVARGEIAGISAGYRVEDWEITNEDGDVLDPEKDKIRWDDELTFTAIRWELHEASLVSVPADASAGIRSFGTGQDRALSPSLGGEDFTKNAIRITTSFDPDHGRKVVYEYGPGPKLMTARLLHGVKARMLARQNMMERMSKLRG